MGAQIAEQSSLDDRCNGGAAGAQPELFLVLLALACIARFVLFSYVEGMGSKAKIEGLGVTSGFGGLALVTLIVWALRHVI